MQFSLVVKTVRTKLGLSQEQLAQELKISFSTVNRWENEISRPSQMARELFYLYCKSKDIDHESISKGDVINDQN